MATRAAIRAGLVTRLETISGVHIYGTETPDVVEFPAIVVFNGNDDPQMITGGGAGGTWQWRLPARVYIEAPVPDEGWAELDTFQDRTGANSIDAAILGDRTLGGACDTMKILNYEGVIRDPNSDDSINIYSIMVTFLITATG